MDRLTDHLILTTVVCWAVTQHSNKQNKRPKDADRNANSVDHDQTAVCHDLGLQIVCPEPGNWPI